MFMFGAKLYLLCYFMDVVADFLWMRAVGRYVTDRDDSNSFKALNRKEALDHFPLIIL